MGGQWSTRPGARVSDDDAHSHVSSGSVPLVRMALVLELHAVCPDPSVGGLPVVYSLVRMSQTLAPPLLPRYGRGEQDPHCRP